MTSLPGDRPPASHTDTSFINYGKWWFLTQGSTHCLTVVAWPPRIPQRVSCFETRPCAAAHSYLGKSKGTHCFSGAWFQTGRLSRGLPNPVSLLGTRTLCRFSPKRLGSGHRNALRQVGSSERREVLLPMQVWSGVHTTMFEHQSGPVGFLTI